MEDLAIMKDYFAGLFRGQAVLVTGHTGFKGSWLCEWLLSLGAKVHGISLDPEPGRALFDELNLSPRLASDTRLDICDASRLAERVGEIKPAFLFHLAAQSLVRPSYADPLRTFQTNVMGTAHVLEALRPLQFPCVAIIVTTDKVYDNQEWTYGYREHDALGGRDPYSASKSAAEMVTRSYRDSFFAAGDCPVQVASARAGNVIGGGDWAMDRIVPDCIRALEKNACIGVRNPHSTRPWQHVLEPLAGYLWLAACLAKPSIVGLENAKPIAHAFNFGPVLDSNQPVKRLVEEVLRHWSGTWEDLSEPNAPHEMNLLNLSSDLAHHQLRWSPVWSFAETIAKTVQAYRQASQSSVPWHDLVLHDIESFSSAASQSRHAWAPGPHLSSSIFA